MWVWRTERGFLIALTYGRETEWLKNVLATNGCRIEQRKQSTPVGNPRLVGPDEALPHVGSPMRPVLRALGIRHWLLLDSRSQDKDDGATDR